eukprot:CAMPEP_0197531402 /NCGR_PEP_ID=MMETSP1318-20131121/35499_1 /TAXON_ID=552666 /ORGANISM="Partenskyella glossopodia, Strain RCC365" /LENGTH=387 /DNA_ID=CAMNT_0043087607 /DNA_START=165 /DNA_END=1328 /DNA_ORIENTATION=+
MKNERGGGRNNSWVEYERVHQAPGGGYASSVSLDSRAVYSREPYYSSENQAKPPMTYRSAEEEQDSSGMPRDTVRAEERRYAGQKRTFEHLGMEKEETGRRERRSYAGEYPQDSRYYGSSRMPVREDYSYMPRTAQPAWISAGYAAPPTTPRESSHVMMRDPRHGQQTRIVYHEDNDGLSASTHAFHQPFGSFNKKRDSQSRAWSTLADRHPMMRPADNDWGEAPKKRVEYALCSKWARVTRWNGTNIRKQSLTFQEEKTVVEQHKTLPHSQQPLQNSRSVHPPSMGYPLRTNERHMPAPRCSLPQGMYRMSPQPHQQPQLERHSNRVEIVAVSKRHPTATVSMRMSNKQPVSKREAMYRRTWHDEKITPESDLAAPQLYRNNLQFL